MTPIINIQYSLYSNKNRKFEYKAPISEKLFSLVDQKESQ